jgi:hypothetical protein
VSLSCLSLCISAAERVQHSQGLGLPSSGSSAALLARCCGGVVYSGREIFRGERCGVLGGERCHAGGWECLDVLGLGKESRM